MDPPQRTPGQLANSAIHQLVLRGSQLSSSAREMSTKTSHSNVCLVWYLSELAVTSGERAVPCADPFWTWRGASVRDGVAGEDKVSKGHRANRSSPHVPGLVR